MQALVPRQWGIQVGIARQQATQLVFRDQEPILLTPQALLSQLLEPVYAHLRLVLNQVLSPYHLETFCVEISLVEQQSWPYRLRFITPVTRVAELLAQVDALHARSYVRLGRRAMWW